MNISEKAKEELCTKKYEQSCCKIALLSAFVRTAGSIVSERNLYGFSVTSSTLCAEYFGNIEKELFNVEPLYNMGKNSISGFTVLSDNSVEILIELGILKFEDGGLSVVLSPEEYITENDCCKRAYITGAFLGGGYITVPDSVSKNSTGYHLEFVFSKYLTAKSFAELLCEVGFMPKLIERKGSFIVYFKQHEEIKDLLAYIGATYSALDLIDLVVRREVNNNTNRVKNCDISNIGKTVEASLVQCNAIRLIEETVGLESLPEILKETAIARLDNSDSPLSDLAEELGVSKGCLNYRLRKIMAIAENLK